MLETSNFVHGSAMQSLSLVMSVSYVGVVRVTRAISRLWTLKISPQQVVGIQVIYTSDRRRFVYDTLPPTKPPTSYHRFGQVLSYK